MKRIKAIKRIEILTLISVATIALANHQQFFMLKTIEADWLVISDSAQKSMILENVYALDSFAQAMPIVGGDTESSWAADTVHVIAKRVKEGQRAFLESMSEIYQMQNYIAYGMSYRIATIGLALDTSKLCNYVLTDLSPVTFKVHPTSLPLHQPAVHQSDLLPNQIQEWLPVVFRVRCEASLQVPQS